MKTKMHPHQNFKHLVDLKNKKSNVIPLLRALPEKKSRLSVPLTIHFKHKLNHVATIDDAHSSVCVLWDIHNHKWNSNECNLLMTNRSHSTCACQRLGIYALLIDPLFLASSDEQGLVNDLNSATVVIIIVSSSILVLLSIILIVVGVGYYRHMQVTNDVFSI